MPDGLEVKTYGSNPLWADPDDDGDGWYWFQDCQDDDAERAPLLAESLDAKDNDCDEEVDEDFRTLDSDQDGLWDYDEFHNLSTDPTDSDSDDDGMSDGKEVKETGSDPLVFDHDRDEDGFYAFEDCEDLIETINPDATETWNGWDDDCNDVVDDSLNRADLIESSLSRTSTVEWDSVNDTLRIDIRNIPTTVTKEMVWEMEGIILSSNWSENGQTLIIEEIDCKSKDWELAEILCSERSGIRELNLTITDSGFETKLQWTVDVEVYIPSPTLIESLFSFLGSSSGIVVILLVILCLVGGVALAGMKIRENKMIAEAYAEFRVNQSPPGVTPEHRAAELPAAPDLSALLSQHSDNNPPMVESVPMLQSTVVTVDATAIVSEESSEEE